MGPRRVRPVAPPAGAPTPASRPRRAHERRRARRARLAAPLAGVVVLGAAAGLVIRLVLDGGAAPRATPHTTAAPPAPTSSGTTRPAAAPPTTTTPPTTTVPPTTTTPPTTTVPTTTVPPTTTTPLALAPRDVLVEVLNGSGATGLAGQTAVALRARGFRINGTGNAPTYTFVANVAEYSSGSVAAARTVAAELTGTTELREVPGLVANEVDLVVGATFRGLVAR